MGFNIQDLIGGSLTDGIAKIIGLFKVDPTLAMEKQVELGEIKLQIANKLQDQFNQQVQGQIDTNKQEAASTNWFVAGWRPMVGWVCALGLFIQFLVNPFATWGAALAGKHIVFPSVDISTLYPLVLGMLGLGAMRTFEKVNGVDNTHPNE